MHKISVPIKVSTINENNREKYVKLCKSADVERIFLAIGSGGIDGVEENVDFFKNNGFEVGVWIDSTGHGFVLAHAKSDNDAEEFKQIVNIDGVTQTNSNCPLDKNFRDYFMKRIAKLVKTGVDIILLDDDFRMSQHGKDALCCACPMHLTRMSEILGEDVTLEKLRPHMLSGDKNRYRDAWLYSQNEGLVNFAKEIRAQVDSINPDVNVCICTAHAPWNADGMDVPEIVRILAGNNPPLVRLSGAPYWAMGRTRPYSLISVFEVARMTASYVKDEGFELMSEGDVYPRPRYTCPASYLELFDAATRVDGVYNGILKYMFDYIAGPDLEMGYLHFHNRNKPYYDKLRELFPNGANTGVRIIAYPNTFKNANLDISSFSVRTLCSHNGTMIASSGIPTVYGKDGICNSVFGENARQMDLSLLNDGTILDAVSAVILTQRGVDVGIKDFKGFFKTSIPFLSTSDPEFKSYIRYGDVRMLDASISENAKPILFCDDKIIAYRYQNENGQRFIVFMHEGDVSSAANGMTVSGLLKNPVLQKILPNEIEWLAQKPLPAYCVGNPELYIMCEQSENSLSVALFNCFADSLAEPVIHLSENYKQIECVNCTAVIDGNKVTLTSELHAFSMASFRLYK